MKKLIALLTIAGFMTFGISNIVLAQTDEQQAQTEQTEVAVTNDSVAAAETPAVAEETPAVVEETPTAPAAEEKTTFHESLKEQFIDGGWGFMGIILLCLIFALAICIERIIYLALSSVNTENLINTMTAKLENEGVAAAKDYCRGVRGPVASIFYQGLLRFEDGQSLDDVEKSLVSYGSVKSSELESGISWIGLFMAMAPSLGFMGTAIGMIQAFDDIAAAGDISPTIVAAGMKVALLTTVFGLIVAIILQVFYNYIISRVETIVRSMEDASISFMDILVKYNKNNK